MIKSIKKFFEPGTPLSSPEEILDEIGAVKKELQDKIDKKRKEDEIMNNLTHFWIKGDVNYSCFIEPYSFTLLRPRRGRSGYYILEIASEGVATHYPLSGYCSSKAEALLKAEVFIDLFLEKNQEIGS